MTDRIPDEIMQEAMRIARDTECMPSDGNVRIIARALMARDQRAAEIARTDDHDPAAGEWIASRILSYDEAQQ